MFLNSGMLGFLPELVLAAFFVVVVARDLKELVLAFNSVYQEAKRPIAQNIGLFLIITFLDFSSQNEDVFCRCCFILF